MCSHNAGNQLVEKEIFYSLLFFLCASEEKEKAHSCSLSIWVAEAGECQKIRLATE